MTIEGQKFYPGETAAPEEILRLANEYNLAANELKKFGRKGQPISRAPFRLIAIHAIELYLNAFLISKGFAATEVRSLQHNFGKRADLALSAGLKLRKLTEKHLRTLSEKREYLVSRYDPVATEVSELNRLVATLREIGDKVTDRINSCAGSI